MVSEPKSRWFQTRRQIRVVPLSTHHIKACVVHLLFYRKTLCTELQSLDINSDREFYLKWLSALRHVGLRPCAMLPSVGS